MKDLNKVFNEIKRLLDNEDDNKQEVEGFYFNEGAIELIQGANKDFFLNSYYNLPIYSILNMVEENATMEDVRKELFEEYKQEYASAWYENFKEVLRGVEI